MFRLDVCWGSKTHTHVRCTHSHSISTLWPCACERNGAGQPTILLFGLKRIGTTVHRIWFIGNQRAHTTTNTIMCSTSYGPSHYNKISYSISQRRLKSRFFIFAFCWAIVYGHVHTHKRKHNSIHEVCCTHTSTLLRMKFSLFVVVEPTRLSLCQITFMSCVITEIKLGVCVFAYFFPRIIWCADSVISKVQINVKFTDSFPSH